MEVWEYRQLNKIKCCKSNYTHFIISTDNCNVAAWVLEEKKHLVVHGRNKIVKARVCINSGEQIFSPPIIFIPSLLCSKKNIQLTLNIWLKPWQHFLNPNGGLMGKYVAWSLQPFHSLSLLQLPAPNLWPHHFLTVPHIPTAPPHCWPSPALPVRAVLIPPFFPSPYILSI